MKLTEGFQLLATAPDGVARLRELILSLAVQGKLVTQNPGDESATSLLRQVRAQKDRLIGEGKIRRDKPLPKIADGEKPFTLPAGWEWARMQQIADARLGKMLDKAKNSGKPYPYLRNTNVQWHRFNLEDIKVINLEAHELDEYRLRSGDLLICEGGEPGRCAIWREQQQEMYFQKALHRVRLLAGILPEYVALCLEIDAKSLRLEQYFTGATIKHFAGQELSRYCVPLPPLAEQSRIVAKVDELMRLCDQLGSRGRLEAEQHARLTTTLLDALATSESPQALAENWSRVAAHFDLLLDRPEAVDALEQTILQLAVRGLLVPRDANDEPAIELLRKIRLQKDRLIAEGEIKRDKPTEPIADDETPFDVPDGWKWARLADVVLKVSDGPHFSPNYVDEASGVPFLSARNIRTDKFLLDSVKFVSVEDHAAFSQRTTAALGDILYTKGGTTGVAKVNDLDFEFSVWVHVAVLNLPHPHVSPEYLALALNSPHCYAQSQRYTHGSTNKDLGLTRMVLITVPFPPLVEQRRIVARVDELRRLCADLRARLTARRSCQARFAETLIRQTASAEPFEGTDDLAAAA